MKTLRAGILCSLVAALSAGIVSAQTTGAQAPTKSAGAGSAPEMPGAVMDKTVFTHVLFDQLEGRTDGSNSEFRWDGEGWIGTDWNRFWFKSEGFAGNGRVTDGDLEAFYDRPLPRLKYFDWQAGLREDLDSGPKRTWLALGIEGLAPYFFHLAPTIYFRDGGHLAARVTTSYDLFLTQRLVAQPELEMNFYSKSDPRRRLGSGLSDLDTGIRVRYELRRKFAPYVGFAYTRDFGETAKLVRQNGENAAEPRLVFGLRVWY